MHLQFVCIMFLSPVKKCILQSIVSYFTNSSLTQIMPINGRTNMSDKVQVM
jgi:hypothetical protein